MSFGRRFRPRKRESSALARHEDADRPASESPDEQPAGPRRDTRAPGVIAYDWAWRVITVALEMAVPAALGYFADQHLGTYIGKVPVLTVVGLLLGVTLGFLHLLRMVAAEEKKARRDDDKQEQEHR